MPVKPSFPSFTSSLRYSRIVIGLAFIYLLISSGVKDFPEEHTSKICSFLSFLVILFTDGESSFAVTFFDFTDDESSFTDDELFFTDGESSFTDGESSFTATSCL